MNSGLQKQPGFVKTKQKNTHEKQYGTTWSSTKASTILGMYQP